jgi:hypothetical protein
MQTYKYLDITNLKDLDKTNEKSTDTQYIVNKNVKCIVNTL